MHRFAVLLLAALAFPSAPVAQDPPAAGVILHEWATVTSMVGSDGTPRCGVHRETADLPEFVVPRGGAWGTPWYGLRDPLRLEGLGKLQATQALDACGIWATADAPAEFAARLELPNGLLTRWYPQAVSDTPKFPAGVRALPGGTLDWGKMRLTPPTSAPDQLPGPLQRADPGTAWATARTAEAGWLRMLDAAPMAERFLFARGIADFPQPLAASITETLELTVKNGGEEPLPRLWVIHVPASNVGGLYPAHPFTPGPVFVSLDALGPGESRTIALGGLTPRRLVDLAPEMAGELEAALAAAGLRPSEAQAARRFAQEDWLFTPGVRVLSLLPRRQADSILPLAVEPAPREHVRVWVHRLEVFDPLREREIEKTLSDYVDSLKTDPYAMLETYRLRLLREGRQLDPLLRGVAASTANKDVANLAKRMVATLGVPDAEEAPMLGLESVTVTDPATWVHHMTREARQARIAALLPWLERWKPYAEKTKCDAAGVYDAQIELAMLQFVEEKAAAGADVLELVLPESRRTLPLRPATCGCSRARETGEMPKEQ